MCVKLVVKRVLILLFVVKVAVKIFISDCSPDGRCEDELSVVAVLNHPYILVK
jgi:hypothetical protein